jgi:protein CpxP
MNRTTRTLLLGALLAASPLALAGPGHASHGGKGGHAAPGADAMAGVERQLAGAIRRLDLDANQEAAIRELFEANRADLAANREASRAVREDVRTLLDADTLDEEALAELARREGELAEERILLGGTLASEVLGELTEAQRDELQAMRTEREERRRERFSARTDRKGQD